MPTWGNTDATAAKPKFPMDRQVRSITPSPLVTANVTLGPGANVSLVFQGANSVNNVIGALVGAYVFDGPNVSTFGVRSYFYSNNTIAVVPAFATGQGNTVVLANGFMGNTAANTLVDFGVSANQSPGAFGTFNQDTILITAGRAAPANANTTQAQLGNMNTGWNHIRKKTNSDGTVRWIKETLVSLAAAVASNTNSGNTSAGQIASGT